MAKRKRDGVEPSASLQRTVAKISAGGLQRRRSVNEDEIHANPLNGGSFFAHVEHTGKSGNILAQVMDVVAASTDCYQHTVQGLQDPLREEKSHSLQAWQGNFAEWRLQLRAGFSILFYGYGSKRRLLDDFAAKQLLDGGLVNVNAWRPGLPATAKQIVIAAASALLGNPQSHFRNMSSGGVISMMQSCKQDLRVYVLINNLDAPSLRSPLEQAILAELAACRCVHLVAAVDHINAPALFDKRTSDQFQWIWHHVPSFDPMLVETLGVAPILENSKQVATHRSAGIVLRTLSHSSQEVFRVLAAALLDDLPAVDEHPEGIPFERLFRLCRERFLISSDVTLKSHLTEFRDHELIKTRRDADGVDLLYIPLSAAKLQDLLESISSTAE